MMLNDAKSRPLGTDYDSTIINRITTAKIAAITHPQFRWILRQWIASTPSILARLHHFIPV